MRAAASVDAEPRRNAASASDSGGWASRASNERFTVCANVSSWTLSFERQLESELEFAEVDGSESDNQFCSCISS